MCSNCEWSDALASIKDCLARVEDLPERAEDFGTSCTERLQSMAEWIEQNEHVTDRMQEAIDGISAGLDRWDV